MVSAWPITNLFFSGSEDVWMLSFIRLISVQCDGSGVFLTVLPANEPDSKVSGNYRCIFVKLKTFWWRFLKWHKNVLVVSGLIVAP